MNHIQNWRYYKLSGSSITTQRLSFSYYLSSTMRNCSYMKWEVLVIRRKILNLSFTVKKSVKLH